jgi:predicted nucleotidyltransferase
MRTIKTSLSTVLFSKSRQAVLSLVYGQPERDFYTNEIIRLSHVGTGAVHRELEALTNAGLITVKNVGNQKHYRANREGPLFSEIRGIVLKTFGLADVLRQALLPITSKIDIAFIYGSIAKQEDTGSSDIDLMLISDNLTYADLFKYLESTEALLHRPVNPTFYSSKEWSQKIKSGNNFLTQVIKQPKIFLVGTGDELSKLG